MGKKQEFCIGTFVRGPLRFCGRSIDSVWLVGVSVAVSRCVFFAWGSLLFLWPLCVFCWTSPGDPRWGYCKVGFRAVVCVRGVSWVSEKNPVGAS